MNYGPLLFLAAFFALASSWCGFVLSPQLQIGHLQQTNTLGSAAMPYPVARPRAGAAGHGSLSRQRLRLLPQPTGWPDGNRGGYCANGGGNKPGGHRRRAAQAGRERNQPAERSYDTGPVAAGLFECHNRGDSGRAAESLLPQLEQASRQRRCQDPQCDQRQSPALDRARRPRHHPRLGEAALGCGGLSVRFTSDARLAARRSRTSQMLACACPMPTGSCVISMPRASKPKRPPCRPIGSYLKSARLGPARHPRHWPFPATRHRCLATR